MRAAFRLDGPASGRWGRRAAMAVALATCGTSARAQPAAPTGAAADEAGPLVASSAADTTWGGVPGRLELRPLRAGVDSLGLEGPGMEALRPDVRPFALNLDADTTADGRKRSIPLTVFGYYRLFLYGRNMTTPYPNLAPYERTYGVGDGYREPMLSLTVSGRPSGRASFGSEIFVFSPYDGNEDAATRTVSLNLGVNFYGNFRTEAGTFGVRAGGIHWYNLSPFTIGVFQVLDRFSIFDRTPWEGVAGAARYENYFRTGVANPGDARFNYQAFQGLILNGQQLPGRIAFDAFWGKTQPNGGLPGAVAAAVPGDGGVPTYEGFSGDARALPSFITGGRLQRTFGASRVSLNTIYSYRTLDSLSTERRQYQVHTTEFDLNGLGVNVTGELGASLFESPTYTSRWGEALMLRAKTPAARTGLPLDLQVYQIGRNFFNENSEIATGNNPQLRTDPRCEVTAGQGGSGGALTLVNQLAHNRRGVNFNTAWGRGPVRFAVGWGAAHELAPTTTDLSYVHRVNGLALSRVYNPFPAEATCATTFGPLGRQYSFFRGVFERVPTTDVEPVTGFATNRKYYHAVDLQGKARATVLERPLYLFYLGSFGSANTRFRPVPTDDDTYLFVQYHEVDLYYELVPGFLATGYLGLENARGGRFTTLDAASGLPRDQHARGLGLGFDWTVARNAGLYLRHRWMRFEDRSFAVDTYSGREVTLELKMFF